MPTKVCIIDVDLGLSVDDIIGEEVEDLTGAAAKELNNALEIAKATQRVKQERDAATRKADTKLNDAMEGAFKSLVEAGDAGLPVSTVMAAVTGVVPNSSAFALRMKSILSQKGNPYILERKKVHGTPHYVFMPFNYQPEPPPPADGSQQ
jgi:hypothetical protein